MPTPQSDAGCAEIARARRRGHLAKSARPWRCAGARGSNLAAHAGRKTHLRRTWHLRFGDTGSRKKEVFGAEPYSLQILRTWRESVYAHPLYRSGGLFNFLNFGVVANYSSPGLPGATKLNSSPTSPLKLGVGNEIRNGVLAIDVEQHERSALRRGGRQWHK